MNQKVRYFSYHLAGWVFYAIYSTAATYVGDTSRQFVLWRTILYILINACLFYAIILIVNPLIFENKNFKKGLILYAISCTVFYFMHYIRIWSRSFTEKIPDYFTDHSYLIPQFLVVIIQFTAFALVYGFYHYSLRQQKEKLELEKRSHEIEVSFLKSQINEHFTYNMLNRFHTEASKYSEQLADGILSLSELMRYSVKEHENTMVTLSEEIKYTQMLIALNRQRLDNRVEVNFDIEGNLEQPWKIPHLCILTLVENAFKHGAIRQAPLQLHLKVTQEQLWFSTKNKIKPSISEPSTGIGVKNLERRLDLLCEGRATLEAHIEDNYFYTNLEIKAPEPNS